MTTILIGAEHQLDTIDAPAEEKSRVREGLQQMRDTGATLATGASGELLGAVLRKGLGLG